MPFRVLIQLVLSWKFWVICVFLGAFLPIVNGLGNLRDIGRRAIPPRREE